MPFGLGLGILFLALYPGRSANKFGLLTGQIVSVDNAQLGLLIAIRLVVIVAPAGDLAAAELRQRRRRRRRGPAGLPAARSPSSSWCCSDSPSPSRSRSSARCSCSRCSSRRPPRRCGSPRRRSRTAAVECRLRGVLGGRRHPARRRGWPADQPVRHDHLVRHLPRLPHRRSAPHASASTARRARRVARKLESPHEAQHLAAGSGARGPRLRRRVRERPGSALQRCARRGRPSGSPPCIGPSPISRGRVRPIRCSPTEGESLYRACTPGQHHHHLICRGCGLTVEIEANEVEAVGHAASLPSTGSARPATSSTSSGTAPSAPPKATAQLASVRARTS